MSTFRLIVVYAMYLALSINCLNAQEFTKAYGNTNNNKFENGFYSVSHDAYFVVGAANLSTGTLTKIDRNGNVIWSKSFSGSYFFSSIDELQAPDKSRTDVILTPNDYGTYNDLYVMRVDGDNGNVIWSKKFKYASANRFASLIITKDQKIIASNTIRYSGGLFMVKLDHNGNTIWSKLVAGDNFQRGTEYVADDENGFVFGYILGSYNGVAKFTSDGNVSILKRYSNMNAIRNLKINPDGTYLLSGYKSWETRDIDPELIYLDKDLNVIWSRFILPVNNIPSNHQECCANPSAFKNNRGEIIMVRESRISGELKTSFSIFSTAGQHTKSVTSNYNDISVFATKYAPFNNIVMYGGSRRDNICLPTNTNSLLISVKDDLDICDTKEFTPRVTNSNTTFIDLNLNVLTISNAAFVLSDPNIIATDITLRARNLCSTDEEKVNLGPDITTCTLQSVTLNAGTGYKTYQWSNGASTPSIQVNTSGTFWVKTTDDCDRESRDTIKVAISRAISRSQNVRICQGESYRIGNKVYTTQGTYIDSLTSSSGCDSIIRTTLAVDPKFSQQQSFSICQGDSIKVGNRTYKASGTYRDSLRTFRGCDSVIVTNLTVNPALSRSQTLTICQGDSIKVGNRTYKVSGTYRDTLKTPFNCDSIIVTQLTVRPNYQQQRSFSICQGDSVKIGNQIFKTPGNFTVRLSSIFGCDSIISANISVQEQLTTSIDTSICEGNSIRIGNETYTQSGNYSATLTSVGGCDSIVSLNLSVSASTTSIQSFRICRGDSIKVGSDVYTSTGDYNFSYKYPNGCDSLVIQTSIVVDEPLNVSLGSDTTLCFSEQIELRPATTSQEIVWNTGSTQSSIDVNEAGIYSVQVTNACGTFVDSIQVNFEDCDCKVFIPNAFSPNGDGKNDVLVIKEENIISSTLIIYNKWGEKVFISENNSKQWNGVYKDKPAQPDAYGYHYEGKCLKGNIILYKGSINIVR